MMALRLLFDSDVLIDFLRGRTEAVDYLNEPVDEWLMSTVTLAELYAGVRDGPERATLDQFVMAFELVPLNPEIAVRGGIYRRDFRKSHGLELADCLIAATAAVQGATLVTLNQKHFPMLTDVTVPYKKP